MDNQVPFAEIEKAIDGPGFELAPREDNPDFLAMEELVVTQNQHRWGSLPVFSPLYSGERGGG
jgi:hypothetical protein